MLVLPLYLTLISFIISILFGKYIGTKGVCLITVVNIFLTVLISLFLFYEVCFQQSIVYMNICNWLNLDILELDYAFIYDSLTVTMLLVVSIVSFCAHIYSVEYMYNDPHQIRFMSYLSLFTFFMLILITSANIIQLFIGWEGVGICSYLLINFWYSRIKANKSAIMAVIVNKVGDIALMVSIGYIYVTFKSFNYFAIFNIVYAYNIGILYTININYISIIVLLFIIGAVGKSAQLGLHMWLPEAMEGPTPVSSLIHAATMVTAGIFLVIRCSYIFEIIPNSLLLIIFIGSITTFFASTIGLFQNDLKKVVAYSTCSQLGYMFMSCGLSGYHFSMFHLFNHAFFKALLFLTAGYIIHSIVNEQDIRKMGGLLKLLPFSYTMILLSSLSLAGFPYFSGFFSKEKIIELYNNRYINIYDQLNKLYIVELAQWICMVAAIFTILYSIRLIYNVFYNNFNGFNIYILNPIYNIYNKYYNYYMNIHYGNIYILLPLLILFMLTIFSGFIFKDAMIGVGTDYWNSSLFVKMNNIYILPEINYIQLLNFEFNYYMRNIILYWTLYFITIFSIIYLFYTNILYLYKMSNVWIYSIFIIITEKYIYITKIIELFNKIMMYISYHYMYLLIDKGLLEYYGPYGVFKLTSKSANIIGNYSKKYLFFMFLYIILGICIYIII